jgi:hypothetical protein
MEQDRKQDRKQDERAYEAPHLRVLGKLSDLTKGEAVATYGSGPELGPMISSA